MVILFIILFIAIISAQFTYAKKLGNSSLGVFIVSFALRAFLLLLFEVHFIDLVDAGSDTEVFKREAIYLYNRYNTIDLLQFWELQAGAGTFPILMALIYKIFSPEYIIISLINILLFNSVIIHQTKVLNYFSLSPKLKLVLLMLIAFFPMLLSYSVIVLREMYYVFVVSLISLEILNFYKGGKVKSSFFWLITSSGIAVILHPGMLTFFVFSFFIIFFKKGFFNWKLISFVFFSFFSITSIINAGYGGGYFNFLFKSNNSDEAIIAKISNSREESIFRYEKLYQDDMLYNLLVAMPVDYFNFFISPNPLPLGNLFYFGIWRYPAGLISALILILLISKRTFDVKLTRIFIILLLLATLPFVVGSGDVVQAVRHKMKFLPIFIILFALVYEKLPKTTKT